MRKFYELIQPEGIRKHCEKIDYTLDACQCAYLVWENQNLPIEEKHRLYDAIMNEREDCEIINIDDSRVSFFNALKEHIKLEVKALEKFKKDADEKTYEYDFEKVTKLKEIRKTYSGYVKNLKADIEAYVSKAAVSSILTDSWIEDFFMICYRPSLPIPYRKGDIVQSSGLISGYDICVFERIDDDYEDNLPEGEASFVSAYIIYPDGMVDEVSVARTQLDYYSGEETLEYKMCKALSDCIRGNISPVTLMNAQRVFVTKNKKEELYTMPCYEEAEYVKKLFAIDSTADK